MFQLKPMPHLSGHRMQHLCRTTGYAELYAALQAYAAPMQKICRQVLLHFIENTEYKLRPRRAFHSGLLEIHTPIVSLLSKFHSRSRAWYAATIATRDVKV